MERTRIFTALQGVRGRPPVDVAALAEILVRLSQLVVEQPRIRELDVNPLLASPERLLALDARVVLHGPDVAEAALPRPAIRPYPREYVTSWRTRDGVPVTFRPIRPEDEPRLAAFHETLSEQSVYFRYLHPIALSQRIAHERLARICFADYDRQMVLVAERAAAGTGPAVGGAPEILGVGRVSRVAWTVEAEFALLVSDQFQRRGLGTELLRRLLAVARTERIHRVVGHISPENQPMLGIARRLGFRLARQKEDPTLVGAALDL
jgi:acetyltransferase